MAAKADGDANDKAAIFGGFFVGAAEPFESRRGDHPYSIGACGIKKRNLAILMGWRMTKVLCGTIPDLV